MIREDEYRMTIPGLFLCFPSACTSCILFLGEPVLLGSRNSIADMAWARKARVPRPRWRFMIFDSVDLKLLTNKGNVEAP